MSNKNNFGKWSTPLNTHKSTSRQDFRMYSIPFRLNKPNQIQWHPQIARITPNEFQIEAKENYEIYPGRQQRRAFWWLSSQVEICSRPQCPAQTANSVWSHVTINICNYTFKPKKTKVANTKLCQVILYSPRISTEIQEIALKQS